MAEITRRKTLERCLMHMNELKRKVSRDELCLAPLDDETAESFYELDEMTRHIREIIQDYDDPGVQEACARWRNPAKWQRDLMAGQEPVIRFREGEQRA